MCQNKKYLDVYDKETRNSPAMFSKWLHRVLRDFDGKVTCGNYSSGGGYQRIGMSEIFKAQMLDSESRIVPDAFTQAEDYYPSLEIALSKFEAVAPNTIEWERFERAQANNLAKMVNAKKMPYSCFYGAAEQRLVEFHDSALLEKFGYSFTDLEPCPLTFNHAG